METSLALAIGRWTGRLWSRRSPNGSEPKEQESQYGFLENTPPPEPCPRAKPTSASTTQEQDNKVFPEPHHSQAIFFTSLHGCVALAVQRERLARSPAVYGLMVDMVATLAVRPARSPGPWIWSFKFKATRLVYGGLFPFMETSYCVSLFISEEAYANPSRFGNGSSKNFITFLLWLSTIAGYIDIVNTQQPWCHILA